MEGSAATRRQPVACGEKAKHHPFPHASREEWGYVLDHATTGLLQVGVGSHSECAARIQHQRGQCPDASARIRQEQRS
jgi:hypothetical protein